MDLELIKDALVTSLDLLNEEIESVMLDDLKEEYLSTIKKLENALKVLKENG